MTDVDRVAVAADAVRALIADLQAEIMAGAWSANRVDQASAFGQMQGMEQALTAILNAQAER